MCNQQCGFKAFISLTTHTRELKLYKHTQAHSRKEEKWKELALYNCCRLKELRIEQSAGNEMPAIPGQVRAAEAFELRLTAPNALLPSIWFLYSIRLSNAIHFAFAFGVSPELWRVSNCNKSVRTNVFVLASLLFNCSRWIFM